MITETRSLRFLYEPATRSFSSTSAAVAVRLAGAADGTVFARRLRLPLTSDGQPDVTPSEQLGLWPGYRIGTYRQQLPDVNGFRPDYVVVGWADQIPATSREHNEIDLDPVAARQAQAAAERALADSPLGRHQTADRISAFDRLCALVAARGAHFDRDFGHWVRLRLADEQFLELDSYGHNLLLKQGSGDYLGIYAGFAGSTLEWIGSHFGPPTVRATMLRIAELNSAVGAAPEQRAESTV
jgi:hypothetical protein